MRKGATQVICSIFEYLENLDLQNRPILVLLIIRMLQLMNGVNKEAAKFLKLGLPGQQKLDTITHNPPAKYFNAVMRPIQVNERQLR